VAQRPHEQAAQVSVFEAIGVEPFLFRSTPALSTDAETATQANPEAATEVGAAAVEGVRGLTNERALVSKSARGAPWRQIIPVGPPRSFGQFLYSAMDRLVEGVDLMPPHKLHEFETSVGGAVDMKNVPREFFSIPLDDHGKELS
jgi:hypothetical protein